MNPISNEIKAQECSICLDDDIVDKVTLACSHVFHVECLDSWLFAREQLANCPLCRQRVKVLDPKNMKAFILSVKLYAKDMDAEMHFDIGSYDKALVDVNSALRLDPTNGLARCFRARIYYHQGRLREAFYEIYKFDRSSSESGERLYRRLETELIASGVDSFKMECALFVKLDNHFVVIEEVD